MRPEAVEALLFHTQHTAGNPSGSHWAARAARQVIDEARDTMAELLGVRPGEVSFTSGGTEANNLALFGVTQATKATLAVSAIEHAAVLEPTKALGGHILPVNTFGQVDVIALEQVLCQANEQATLGGQATFGGKAIGLVSTMLVNNEIGSIHPLEPIAQTLMEFSKHENATAPIYLHTDAVQAPNWIDVAAAAQPAHLISVSAHKFGGPKGVGAIAIREGTPIRAVTLGGGQERERRSGTQNVAGIAAMAAAAKAVMAERAELVARVGVLRDKLVSAIEAELDGVHETPVDQRAAGFAHLCFDEVESEPLLFLLDQKGVAASAASSCASGALEPSHVLEAIGIAPKLAKGSLRLSLGHTTTEADINGAAAAIVEAVEQLRGSAL